MAGWLAPGGAHHHFLAEMLMLLMLRDQPDLMLLLCVECDAGCLIAGLTGEHVCLDCSGCWPDREMALHGQTELSWDLRRQSVVSRASSDKTGPCWAAVQQTEPATTNTTTANC